MAGHLTNAYSAAQVGKSEGDTWRPELRCKDTIIMDHKNS